MIGVVEEKKTRNGPATVIKVGVTWAGKEAIEQIAARYGMKEQEAAGRIYQWFVRQDDIVQRAVMGLLEGLEVDAARRFMERLARERAAGGLEVGDVSVEGEAGSAAPKTQPPPRPLSGRRKAPGAKRRRPA